VPVLPRSPGHVPKPAVFRTDEVVVLVNWKNLDESIGTAER
jgi:hypothetical protein